MQFLRFVNSNECFIHIKGRTVYFSDKNQKLYGHFNSQLTTTYFFFIFLKLLAVDINVFSPWREIVAFQRDGDDARVSLGYSPLYVVQYTRRLFCYACISNYELSK